MRLVARFTDREQAVRFSQFLSSEKIDNNLEAEAPEANAKGPILEVWVTNEDRIEEALAHYETFQKDPDHAQFRTTHVTIEQAEQEEEKEPPRRSPLLLPGARGIGKVTLLLIIASAVIFLSGGIQMFQSGEGENSDMFFVVSPVYSALMYDYPEAFAAYAELIEKHPLKEGKLSPDGVAALKKARQIPYWQGFYTEVVARAQSETAVRPTVTMFEKIREGELWRLFTPALLHGGILHIFFNVLWMFILSAQVERRLGWFRFSIFVLIAGILSNTAQYLMTGPLFFGLSGIVTALFGFIWMRQRIAPWEGYQLNKPTVWFLSIFIGAMVLLQLIAFGFELAGRPFINLGIANTAHLVGVGCGILMGRFSLFSIRERA